VAAVSKQLLVAQWLKSSCDEGISCGEGIYPRSAAQQSQNLQIQFT
jgi:hypothetical protein